MEIFKILTCCFSFRFWWNPEALYQEFQGTDAEFTKVNFPTPTRECIEKWDTVYRCSPAPEFRVGDPKATCEKPPTLIKKVTAAALFDLIYDGVPDEIESPAYHAWKLFSLTDLQLADLMEYVKTRKTSREAACAWVTDNLDVVQSFVPPTFPRIIENENHEGLVYSAISIGAFATSVVLWTMRGVYRRRKQRSIRYAQAEFLILLLFGSLMITIGAIVVASPPTNASCVAQKWLIHIGYTLVLVPTIVKVAAINRLMASARRYRRTTLDLKSLYLTVASISVLVIVFLTVWTIVDPPHKEADYDLTDETTSDGETIVNVSYICKSNSNGWDYFGVGWNGLLLLCAVVLAFQSRNVPQAFNESQILGALIVSTIHLFLFDQSGNANLTSSFSGYSIPIFYFSCFVELRCSYYLLHRLQFWQYPGASFSVWIPSPPLWYTFYQNSWLWLHLGTIPSLIRVAPTVLIGCQQTIDLFVS